MTRLNRMRLCAVVTGLAVWGAGAAVFAQDNTAPPPAEAGSSVSSIPGEATPPAPGNQPPATADHDHDHGYSHAIDEAKDSVDKLAREVDQDQRAKDASAGILTFIYRVAERLSFPAFHWVAFALMVSGVVSYLCQLVLGKLGLLLRGSLNLAEILSDAKAFLISSVGLVLTTQAAAENSTFTQSPAAVLSATLAGLVVGFIFYHCGVRQELQAAIGRDALKKSASAKS